MPLRLIPDIHRSTHRIRLFLDRIPRLNLSQGEAHILAHLAEAGDSTIAQLHRALAHRRSTLTSILDRLVERGFVTRTIDPKDRRSFVVRLTAAGKSVAQKTYRELAALEHRTTKHLSKRDLEGFAATVRALEKAAEK